jgi:hypothetical protein
MERGSKPPSTLRMILHLCFNHAPTHLLPKIGCFIDPMPGLIILLGITRTCATGGGRHPVWNQEFQFFQVPLGAVVEVISQAGQLLRRQVIMSLAFPASRPRCA